MEKTSQSYILARNKSFCNFCPGYCCYRLPGASLLLTAEDADDGQSPAQASAAAPEIAALYGERFEIELSHVEPVIEDTAQAPDAPAECVYYKVSRLSPRNEGQKALT